MSDESPVDSIPTRAGARESQRGDIYCGAPTPCHFSRRSDYAADASITTIAMAAGYAISSMSMAMEPPLVLAVIATHHRHSRLLHDDTALAARYAFSAAGL